MAFFNLQTNDRVMPMDFSPALPLSFPVVGLGASAGGLAAFEAFFSGLPLGSRNPAWPSFWFNTWPPIIKAAWLNPFGATPVCRSLKSQMA